MVTGPTGDKTIPVGTVYVGLAVPSRMEAFYHLFQGDRKGIREQTVEAALGHVMEWIR